MAPEFLKTTEELAADTALDRRRPGRSDDVSPALIPLLRTTGGPHTELSQHDEEGVGHAFLVPKHLDDSNSLAASRGIGRAVLISVIVWPLIGLAVWFVSARIL